MSYILKLQYGVCPLLPRVSCLRHSAIRSCCVVSYFLPIEKELIQQAKDKAENDAMLEDHRVREGNNRFSDDEGETKVTPDTTALSRMPARAKQGRVGEIDLSSSDDDWLAVCDGNGGLEDDGTEGERGTEGDTALVRAWYLWCGEQPEVLWYVRKCVGPSSVAETM